MKIIVDEKKCPQNHHCPVIHECPTGAIYQEKFNVPIVDNNLCVKCKRCILSCPMGAFQIEKDE